MSLDKYVKPTPCFDESGDFEAFVIGNAQPETGQSASCVVFQRAGDPDSAIVDRKSSDQIHSDSWRADVAGIWVSVALTPNNSNVAIYCSSTELTDRFSRLFQGDKSAIVNTDGTMIAGAEYFLAADQDRLDRNIKISVVYMPAKDPKFKDLRREHLAGNRAAMRAA